MQAACIVCVRLVRRRRAGALLARAMTAASSAGAEEYAAYRERAARVHAAFFAAGPRAPRPLDRGLR